MTILLRRDKGYRREMRRPGEAQRQSIVFASRNPQRNGIRRMPILKLRLAVELLNFLIKFRASQWTLELGH